MKARSLVQQQELQQYEGYILKLEAKGQDTEFSYVTPPLTEKESDLNKELDALLGDSAETREENEETKSKE